MFLSRLDFAKVGVATALCGLAIWPAAARAEPPPSPASAVVEVAPAAPGTLVVVVDVDGLAADVAGAVTALKKGENALQVAAGTAKVVVRTAAGAVVKEAEVAVASGATARLDVTTRGKIEVATVRGAKIELDGKEVPTSDGKAEVDVDMGKHSLVITRSGYFGRKGDVELGAGQRASVTADLAMFEPENDLRAYAWAGIGGGGALILAAVAIDAFANYDSLGGDTVRWTLMGLGTAGFVGGTILLKQGAEASASPPVQDTPKFDIRLSQTQGGAVARLGMRF
ncbi:MAG: hypothetical protein ACOYOB_01455 [Myxococcota bacterium]